jgi:hypothetical protein
MPGEEIRTAAGCRVILSCDPRDTVVSTTSRSHAAATRVTFRACALAARVVRGTALHVWASTCRAICWSVTKPACDTARLRVAAFLGIGQVAVPPVRRQFDETPRASRTADGALAAGRPGVDPARQDPENYLSAGDVPGSTAASTTKSVHDILPRRVFLSREPTQYSRRARHASFVVFRHCDVQVKGAFDDLRAPVLPAQRGSRRRAVQQPRQHR